LVAGAMGAAPSTDRPPALLAAEVARVEAERAATLATTRRADTDAAAARTRATVQELRASAPLLLGLAVVAGLAVDYYRHESPTHLRRRLLATLRACNVPREAVASAARKSDMLLPQPPLALSTLPTMLLGPTGCGKSTLGAAGACGARAHARCPRSPVGDVGARLGCAA
jgi:hypothetical protein